MNLTDLVEHCASTLEKCGSLLVRKNSDYSQDADVHSNFREIAELCKWLKVDVTKPEGCIQFLILWKIHRLFKLIREGKTPKNEGLGDSFVDEINYLLLLDTYLSSEPK